MKNQIIVVFFCLGISSCVYTNKEILYPGNLAECDTTNVTYDNRVSLIIKNSCEGCHSPMTANAGIILDNYDSAKKYSNQVLGAIHHEPEFAPMPYMSDKLSECNLAAFRTWIRNGLQEK